MNANKAIISEIFNCSALIEIPFFQRSYVWNEELWQRLIDDMEYVEKSKKPHFLGSIILKKGRSPQPGDKFTACYTVVDGQQRLTTFLIYMKVLCLLKNDTSLFNFQFRLMGDKIALLHGKNDVKAFEKVTSMTAPVPLDNPEHSRVIEAYNYLLENVDPSKVEIKSVMINAQFVRIDLDADEDEQQIFDTINSLGVNLTTSELLKNYFFSRETVQEYQNTWENTFEKDPATKAYWDQQIEAGRMKRAMIDLFFDAYFQLFIQDKTYSIAAEDKIMYARVDKLSQSYQHFISNYCSGNKQIILNHLPEYAECFRTIFRPEFCNAKIPKEYSIERINILIFGLKNSTMIPYILYIAKNVADPDELAKMYGIIESYIMRRIAVHATTKNYNNLFSSLILNQVLSADSLLSTFRSYDDSTTYFPDDADLKRGFENEKLTNLQTKGILYLIESYIRPTNSALLLLGFQQYSLEHLMPKKWRNNWDTCASAELAKQRDSKLLTLGNLAIIPQSLNASIRDSSWETKKIGKGNKPGLSMCAAGLMTFSDVLTKEVWDESEIEARATWLYGIAVELWKI